MTVDAKYALKKVEEMRGQLKAMTDVLDLLYVELAPKTTVVISEAVPEPPKKKACCLEALRALGGKTKDGYFFQGFMEQVKSYKESSHHDFRLLKCKTCGALYFYEFYEYVDFSGGNDQIYCTYVPVVSVDAGDMMFGGMSGSGDIRCGNNLKIFEDSSGTRIA